MQHSSSDVETIKIDLLSKTKNIGNLNFTLFVLDLFIGITLIILLLQPGNSGTFGGFNAYDYNVWFQLLFRSNRVSVLAPLLIIALCIFGFISFVLIIYYFIFCSKLKKIGKLSDIYQQFERAGNLITGGYILIIIGTFTYSYAILSLRISGLILVLAGFLAINKLLINLKEQALYYGDKITLIAVGYCILIAGVIINSVFGRAIILNSFAYLLLGIGFNKMSKELKTLTIPIQPLYPFPQPSIYPSVSQQPELYSQEKVPRDFVESPTEALKATKMAQTEYFCQSCGAKLEQKVKYCPHCGEEQK